MRYLEKKWTAARRTAWIAKAKKAFTEHLQQYEYTEVANVGNDEQVRVTPLQPLPAQRKRTVAAADWISDIESDDDERPATPSIHQQYQEYVKEARANANVTVYESPIQYWMNNRRRWPQLTSMALDTFATPVMSDEPERVFSMTGAAISPRRRQLGSDMIRNIMCLKSWIRSGIIQITRALFTTAQFATRASSADDDDDDITILE